MPVKLASALDSILTLDSNQPLGLRSHCVFGEDISNSGGKAFANSVVCRVSELDSK